MEDEEMLNMILTRLYELRDEGGLDSVRSFLNGEDRYFRKNQLNRVMAELKSNGFALVSPNEDDFESQISPEGVLYCEETLMLR